MGLHHDKYDSYLSDIDYSEDKDELNRQKELRKRIEEREEERRLQKELDDFDCEDDFDWDENY